MLVPSAAPLHVAAEAQLLVLKDGRSLVKGLGLVDEIVCDR